MDELTVSDYIAKFLRKMNVDLVFTITGAGDIRLIESIKRFGIDYICTHHEQAAVMASIAHFRLTGNPAVCIVTGGPGAANTLTGVADAYLDSIPCIVIAGQEKLEFLRGNDALRGKGVQGLKMVEIMKSVTKQASLLQSPKDIRKVLEQGFHVANDGRPGPVWIEIPQDLQWSKVEASSLKGYIAKPKNQTVREEISIASVKSIELIKDAKRPLIWVGHGVRLAKTEKNFIRLVEQLGVPVLASWQGADILQDNHPLFVGRAGIYGQRWANFALQSCDLLMCLGTRLAIPQRGYDDKTFATKAKKIIVDIDPAEIAKFQFPVEIPVIGNVRDFIDALLENLSKDQYLDWNRNQFQDWLARCRDWRERFPMSSPPTRDTFLTKSRTNSYWFIDNLSDHLKEEDIIITDMGTSLTCTHATIRIKQGQRMITSTGLGEMGFGLPAAIGASIGDKSRRVILITGEGSLMMNLQELQTLKHNSLPIKIFILNNNGYLTIKHTHNSLFSSQGQAEATSPNSGVSFPDFGSISEAFRIKYHKIKTPLGLDKFIMKTLQSPDAMIADVLMPEFQDLIPKSALKKRDDGSIYSPPLEDLFPFLDPDILERELDLSNIRSNTKG